MDSQPAPTPTPTQPVPEPPVTPYQTPPANNVLAIVGFILAFLFPPVGLILSIIGLSKAKQLSGKGKGLSIAGIILSIAEIIISILTITLIIIFAVSTSIDNLPTQNNTTDNTYQTDYTTTTTKTQRVGTIDFGYVDVPTSWVKFTDPSATDTFMYSDGTSNNIVTLMYYAPSSATAQDYQSTMVSYLQGQGATGITTSTVYDVPGYTSYQIYCVTGGKILIIYLFKASDGNVHFLSVESPTSTADVTAMTAIARSFSMIK
jgi:hypothetical protein